MPTRIGIELSRSTCRIIEIDERPAWRAGPAGSRVRSCTVLPASGPETQARFVSLRGRAAAVVVWGAESTLRQAMVIDGSYEAMRIEGVAALAGAGLCLPSAWSDIAWAPHRPGGATRRPVVVALASGPALSAALQPLVDAGVRVRTVLTPAMALGSLARLRQSVSTPGAAEAYVAVDETASCIALVRSGALMAARDLPWGYLVERHGSLESRGREEVASRLAHELETFIADVGGTVSAVTHVSVCGGLPELRSMAVRLVELLDVEVEPLDSLFGIDEAQRSETTPGLRERGAELRIAWAAAAHQPRAHNLIRARRRAASHAMFCRAAVFAGMVAGLAVGADVSGRAWWQAAEPLLIARARPARAAAPRAPAPGAPLDAAPTPILPALGRRFWLVGGRIVSSGDEERGTKAVENAPGAVALRDAQGRSKQFAPGVGNH